MNWKRLSTFEDRSLKPLKLDHNAISHKVIGRKGKIGEPDYEDALNSY